MGGNQTTAHSDQSIDSIPFWTTKFWLLKLFGWRHPRQYLQYLQYFTGDLGLQPITHENNSMIGIYTALRMNIRYIGDYMYSIRNTILYTIKTSYSTLQSINNV